MKAGESGEMLLGSERKKNRQEREFPSFLLQLFHLGSREINLQISMGGHLLIATFPKSALFPLRYKSP